MSIDKLNPREALGFLTWKVARLATNDLAARFAKAGIDVTVEQWRVLVTLCKSGSMTQGRLCEALSQEKTGVSRLVAALEKRGFLKREADDKDRRVKHIQATDRGRAIVEASVDIAIASRDDLVKDLDPEELAICKKVLWQMVLPTLDPDGPCVCLENEE